MSGITETPDADKPKNTSTNKRTMNRRSVAMTASVNLTESRKHNFDVTGSASIQATLVSIPAPTAFVDFINTSLRALNDKPSE